MQSIAKLNLSYIVIFLSGIERILPKNANSNESCFSREIFMKVSAFLTITLTKIGDVHDFGEIYPKSES